MPHVRYSAVPALRFPVVSKPSRFGRSVRAIVAAHTRMYLAAVADPATGRIDRVLELRVLRMMAL